MKVEYALMGVDLEYEQEIQLGEDSIKLDFLIIKKNPGVILTDPIGEFFEAVNIFEYKSPEDGLSIDDFYKAVAYAFIYKGNDRKTDELHIEDMTLTIVRHTYPRKMMKTLVRTSFTASEEHPGIYRVEGITGLKGQVIVSSRLPEDDYEGLGLLAKGCTKEAVIHYAGRAAASRDGNVKTNSETVIGICLKANRNVDAQLKEDEAMDIGETIKGIFNVVEKEGIKKGREEGRNETNERVAKDMLRKNLPLSLIEEISKLSEPAIRNLAASLGLPVM